MGLLGWLLSLLLGLAAGEPVRPEPVRENETPAPRGELTLRRATEESRMERKVA